MAFTKSGLYVHTLQEFLKGTALTSGTMRLTDTGAKISLLSSAPTDGSGLANFSSATPNWANTNEISGTGWASGGVALSAAAAGATSTTPTVAEGTTGSVRWDMLDIAVSGTTLSLAHACLIYADPVTAPSDLVDALWILVNFGADFSTVAGIFGIQWSGTGLTEIDITP